MNGSQWNLLGTFSFLPNSNHRIELTDDANGSVIADAVKLVPSTTLTRLATWTPTIATSDSYEVYTRWTSHHNRATDATYTIHHQGGSSTVVVNQQENGGEWQLLGTYNLAPGSNHRIELSDQANGVVVADAVYVVPTSATPNNVTWEPTLASTQTVDVYAQWVDGADRADSVTYTVHHAGGSTTVTRNQRTNGGVWNFLGRFTMNPASNHRVEVTDSTNGIVVADAVRFVSATTSGAGLMYVHADHLGTPQKMTDGTQAIVWDAVYEPFGEAYSITGTASNNQRFPGQYADAESGLSYNWFRDYDPPTGRYVQSDLIGLEGGLNTYGYVEGNPLTRIDPRGLAFIEIPIPAAPSWVPEWVKVAGSRAAGFVFLILSISGDTPQCDTDDDCEELYRIDTQTCNGITRTRGPAAGKRCHKTAAERYAACLTGRDIPPLDTWNN